MILGFTGTREGCTPQQLEALRLLLQQLNPQEIHHGGCLGADADCHTLAVELGCRIVVHPSDLKRWRADCPGGEILESKPPLARNADIVGACEVLVACPRGFQEEWRSGTWATVRLAQNRKKRVLLVYPDGRVEEVESL